jgi:hypothetical protein
VCLKAHLRARVGGRVKGRVEGVEAFEGVVVVSCDWLQRTRDGSHTNGRGKEEFALRRRQVLRKRMRRSSHPG